MDARDDVVVHPEAAVRACPECGLEVLNTCYHDGEDVRSVEMEPEKAARLRGETAEDLRDKLALYEEEKMHPSTENLMRWLTPNPKLPEDQFRIAAVCEMAAKRMVEVCPEGPELSAGLRKLLEAKDCFVRASME